MDLPIPSTTEPVPYLNFGIHLQKLGMAEATTIGQIRTIKQLSHETNLNDPEAVKLFLGNKNIAASTKRKIAITYTNYLEYLGKTWQPPTYTITQRIPYIPTEQDIDILIASCRKIISTLLQLLKETAMRIGEALQLKWTDIDTTRKIVNITPEKGSNPRLLPISNKLIDMLNQLTHSHGEHIFSQDKDMQRSNFYYQRKTAAEKLQNPNLKRISFHTLRHWKATMEYHETHDIMHVKYMLGHKSVMNTQIYINLEQALFTNQNDKFTATVAHNENEAIQLIESGFEYITEYGTNKIFRKRK